MTDPPRAPTIAQIPLGPSASGWIGDLAAALGDCAADYLLPSPPNLRLPEGGLATMARAAAEDVDAAAFRMPLRGLRSDPAWRGRRCRSHERNLESLRFADLIVPGGLMVRREALLAAMVGLPPEGADDRWRIVCRRIGRAGRIAELDLPLRRGARDGEPRRPRFAPFVRPSRVLVLGQIEVSTSLYFDFLEASADLTVDFRPLTRLALDAPALAGADLVVLVRELHRFWDEGVIAFLDAAGVPYVWFTDDNFLALRAERAGPSFYAERRMRVALGNAAGVWVSTAALADAHAALHPNVGVWGPVLDPVLPASPAAATGPLTIAVAGGDFRLGGLEGAPLARLQTLSEERQLRLVLTPAAAALLRRRLPHTDIVVGKPERSFRQFIRGWRRWRPDILLHPAGATANAPYKAPTAAIVAHYLGAAPVVADEPAYRGMGEGEGVLRLGPDGAGLTAAADGARTARRADMAALLAAALSDRFGDQGRADRLLALARPPASRDAGAAAAAILGSPRLGRRRLALQLAHQTRRFRG